MADFHIKVKDVKEFVNKERVMYACGDGKNFYATLRAGPNVERYVVEVGEESKSFTKLGEAVRYFNAN